MLRAELTKAELPTGSARLEKGEAGNAALGAIKGEGCLQGSGGEPSINVVCAVVCALGCFVQIYISCGYLLICYFCAWPCRQEHHSL